MVNRIQAGLLAFAFLLIGLAAASWCWLEFGGRFMAHGAVETTEANVVMKVAVLEHLRADRVQEATNLLEMFLDGDFISLGAQSREGNTFRAKTLAAIGREREARRLSGYEPKDQVVRDAVQEAFSLVPADK